VDGSVVFAGSVRITLYPFRLTVIPAKIWESEWLRKGGCLVANFFFSLDLWAVSEAFLYWQVKEQRLFDQFFSCNRFELLDSFVVNL